MKLEPGAKRTQIGFFYMTRKTQESGEVKCNVWTGAQGIIVWDGAEWSPYSEWKNVTLIDDRTTGS